MKKDRGLYKLYKKRNRDKNEIRILEAFKNNERVLFSLSSKEIISLIVVKMNTTKSKLEDYLNS